MPCLLLTTIGRRSGEKHTSPLFYTTAGDAYVIIGSKGGAETQPGWYLNLRANVEVQVGREQFPAHARVATGQEREQLFRSEKSFIVRLILPFRPRCEASNDSGIHVREIGTDSPVTPTIAPAYPFVSCWQFHIGIIPREIDATQSVIRQLETFCR